MKNISFFIIALGLAHTLSAQSQSAIQFFDSTGSTPTAKLGWKGDANSGHFFLEKNDNNTSLLKSTATGLETPGSVKAASFIGDGSGLTNLNFENNLIWKGAWNSQNTYIKDNLVQYQGNTYIALQNNQNITPANTNNVHWALLASKGDPNGFFGRDVDSTVIFAPGFKKIRLLQQDPWAPATVIEYGKVYLSTRNTNTTMNADGTISASNPGGATTINGSSISSSNPSGNTTISGGSITTKSITVDGRSLSVPDYVFEESYNLRPLEEVESFVKTNKHLPEIPKEAEIKSKGLDLTEMNLKLLQKVEELTLYIIEQNKVNLAQEKRIKLLEEK